MGSFNPGAAQNEFAFKKDLLFLDWSQREFDPFQCAREVAEAARCKQKLSSVSQSA